MAARAFFIAVGIAALLTAACAAPQRVQNFRATREALQTGALPTNRNEARVYAMERLAAAVRIGAGEESANIHIKDLTDGQIPNTDFEKAGAVRGLLDSLVADAANNQHVRSILSRMTRKVSNTGVGEATICAAMGKTVSSHKCSMTVLELLQGIQAVDRCQATTLKDILAFLKDYYAVGFKTKNYKAAMDNGGFSQSVQDIAKDALEDAKLTGDFCGGEDEDALPLGQCVRHACPEHLSNARYDRSPVAADNTFCEENAKANGQDWFCCKKPDEEAMTLGRATTMYKKLVTKS